MTQTWLVTVERTRTVTERAEVDVEAASATIAADLARDIDSRDLMWTRNEFATVGDHTVVSCERLIGGGGTESEGTND